MGDVTVVIPTAGRPETLEVTLRTVARQSALDRIERVIVSENLGDERSREVCARFSKLPIEYVVQDPQLTPHAHAAWLLQQSATEFVAVVCDDDLWSPGHVAAGVDALERNAGAAAWFSAFAGAESELALSGFFWQAPLLWLAAGRPERASEYAFGLPELLALSWVFTPFQYSTLVARSQAAASAAPALAASTHQFYSDRVLCVALAREGRIVFEPVVDTVYRAYAGNWQNTQEQAHLKELLGVCEAEVMAEAEQAGLDLPAMWRMYLTDVPGDIAQGTWELISNRFSPAELAEYGLLDLMPPAPAPRPLGERMAARLSRAWKALRGRPL